MDTATQSLKRSSSHRLHINSDEDEDTRASKKRGLGRSRAMYDEDARVVEKPALFTSRDNSKTPPIIAKNAHLKGRKRFTADLKDLKEMVPLIAYGLSLKSIKPGDEEGSIELNIAKDNTTFITLNLIIDESSSYPREHTFYSFVHDSDIPSHLLEVVESMASSSPKPLEATIRSLLASLAASLSTGNFISPDEAYNDSQPDEFTQDEGSESDDGGNYYDDYELGLAQDPSLTQTKFFESLNNHFIEIVASDYKPGLTRLNDNEFIISVSCPVPSLAIPPQALVSWDRRLLQTYSNFTLLISGIRGVYPLLDVNGFLIPSHSQPKFHVGLSARYKPSKEVVLQTIRNFGITSMQSFALDSERQEKEELETMKADNPGRYEKFSLSASMEGALEHLVPILQLRIKYKIGWAGAEVLHTAVRQMQTGPEDLMARYAKEIKAADQQEAKLRGTNSLPIDPFEQPGSSDINLPLLAYCYLVRRFKLCPRYCLVCHRKMETTFEALKPYVCDDKLCTYQYYALNFGPSIEYEIRTNPMVVDLLVSLAYVGAYEHQIHENLPVGLGLRVKMPKPLPPSMNSNIWSGAQLQAQTRPTHVTMSEVGADEYVDYVDFDQLSLELQRAAIVELIDQLPPISKMKEHLERKVGGKVVPQLRKLDENVSPAAWLILRWCVASSTAHIEAITEPDDYVCHIGRQWRQFRFSVGAPDHEARYQSALNEVQKSNKNSRKHPALYGFHGSALRNWHSIIRQGLLIKDAVNGRAYGHGVYFAKDGTVSMGSYAQSSTVRWANSEISPIACVALAEIINLPEKFTSNNPYYVVPHVDWILCRYLLVKKELHNNGEEVEKISTVHYLNLDPKQPLTMGQKKILIPEQSHKLEKLLLKIIAEQPENEPFDAEDELVLSGKLAEAVQPKPQLGKAPSTNNVTQCKPQDDWKHSSTWCNEETFQLLAPPTDSSPQATLSLQKELRAMLKEQETAIKNNALAELGWYLPPELMGDNLFRWMIELHSFDPNLPLAKDMTKYKVPSLLFEIRFPDLFPIQPPFFRIIKPRFLPFSQGGGGHVTIGGSICMDLLTADGWLPSYNVAAVLLQIKLAISNLDPKPARLSVDWDRSYTAYEALEAFKRVATIHGWKVPEGMDKLIH